MGERCCRDVPNVSDYGKDTETVRVRQQAESKSRAVPTSRDCPLRNMLSVTHHDRQIQASAGFFFGSSLITRSHPTASAYFLNVAMEGEC